MIAEEDEGEINILAASGSKATKETFDNEYDEACSKLQLNAQPDELPCREMEQEKIHNYIVNGIEQGRSSSSLYISGMPGTGKTATTLAIIRRIIAD